MKIIKLLITSLILLYSSHAFALSDAKITIKVINEEGMPLEGARVGITYNTVSAKGEVIGFTDASGLFTSSSEAILEVGGSAKKDGYYQTIFNYIFTDVKSGRLIPWNPELSLVLRKIEKPVAMYARNMNMSGSIKLPVVGKEVGFDLIEYDWVAPYGKGKNTDIIFKCDRVIKSDYEYDGTLTITFPNKYDGIQPVKEDRRYGSLLKLPRFAPQGGYQQKLIKYSRRQGRDKPSESDYKEDNNYIFRIRSEEEGGKLVRAMYGKLQGDIDFYPKDPPGIGFTYYLNPDYTRNLEFDPKRNLFENLRSFEQVGL